MPTFPTQNKQKKAAKKAKQREEIKGPGWGRLQKYIDKEEVKLKSYYDLENECKITK